MSRTCSIDADPRKNDWVARRHLEGHNPSQMEEMSRREGHPIKRETIARHLRECVGTTVTGAQVQVTAEAIAATTDDDVAVLVQRQVVQKLKDGEARVTVQHGLQAQQLLDRRAERAKDRELAITLARLLHTGSPPPEAITVRQIEATEVIDGVAVEVV